MTDVGLCGGHNEKKKKKIGPPWRFSGKESACHCRETQVAFLTWEDLICLGAPKPVHHDY